MPFTDWFRGYREIVLEEVKQAAKAEEKKEPTALSSAC